MDLNQLDNTITDAITNDPEAVKVAPREWVGIPGNPETGQPTRIFPNPEGAPNGEQPSSGVVSDEPREIKPSFGVTGIDAQTQPTQPMPPMQGFEAIDPNKTLDNLDAQITTAMKEKGQDYVPDIKDFGNLTEEDKAHTVSAIQDFGAGFNHSLAKTLSLPNEVIDKGLALIGVDVMQYGRPTDNTIKALNRLGIPTYEVDNLANKMGHGSFEALTEWAALQATAPYLAAQQGMTTAKFLAREIGNFTMRHPILSAWLGQTGKAGGETAQAVTGSHNPLVEFGGEMAGGIGGDLAFRTARRAGSLAMKPIRPIVNGAANLIADNLPSDMADVVRRYNPFYKPTPPAGVRSEGLVRDDYDPRNVQNFAQNQVDGSMMRQEQALNDAIESVPSTGTAASIQRRMHEKLQEAEKISKRIVGDFWKRVPLRTRIPVNQLQRDAQALRAELVDNENTRPDALIQKVLEVSSPMRDPATGRMQKSTPTINKLRDLQSQIETEKSMERAKDAPREGFIRNLIRLSEIIDDNIAASLPNDTTIAQARAMSRRHNDLFSRGPINDILAMKRTREFRVNPGESVDKLLDKDGGLEALKQVRDQILQYPVVPTTKFRPKGASNLAATQADKTTLDGMVKDAEDSIRAMFREAASTGGPKAGVKFEQTHGAQIKALANVSGELGLAVQKVNIALLQKAAIEKSALSRFAQADADKAIARIFNDQDPAAVARDLIKHFAGDADAMSGLRSGIISELVYNRAKNNPTKVRELLDGRFGRLVDQVLTLEQKNRLNRIVDTAVRIQMGETKTLRGKLFGAKFSPGIILGRVIGARVGSAVSHTFGGHGNIQTPSIFANMGARFFEKATQQIPADQLLNMAIIDPTWEKMLYSRIPLTTNDFKRAVRTYRRFLATLDTAKDQAIDHYRGKSNVQ